METKQIIFMSQYHSIDHSHVGGAAYSLNAPRNWTMFLQDQADTTTILFRKIREHQKIQHQSETAPSQDNLNILCAIPLG
jgi:hypothetical protein